MVGRMPIYEFHCDGCQKDSEILVRSTRWKGTPCPYCGSTKLEKKLSVFASNVAANESAPACAMQSGGSCCGCPAGRGHSH
jgi:putative FmdB family regulatory protein